MAVAINQTRQVMKADYYELAWNIQINQGTVFALALMFSVLVGAPTAVGQSSEAGQSPAARPDVINSIFTTSDSYLGEVTISLHEENGKLTKDQESKDERSSQSVLYEKVTYAELENDSFKQGAKKRVVYIESSDGALMWLLLRTELEARAVAEYVGRKCSLELIADAWRVRKIFQCPGGGFLGCQSFKDMLDHDDPDISAYFYSRDTYTHTYACFDETSTRFFVVALYHVQQFGQFREEVFDNGQSNTFYAAKIDWSADNSGEIIFTKRGQRPQTVGSIDQSSLTYQTRYLNKMKTQTERTLNIRWSTGRYTENFSGKDDKNKPFNNDSSGLCVKLN